MARRNGDVAELLQRYHEAMQQSPKYLQMAATVYTEIGMPQKAWPLFQKADELQPGVPFIRANLAACAVYVGEIERAQEIYRELLMAQPEHQRNHYQLARLGKATDREHIEAMERVLASNGLSDDRNVFLCYALGKEYEDLEEWDKAFANFERAGNGVMSVADYDIADDLAIVDEIIRVCNADWLAAAAESGDASGPQPQFVVGLPRTGTTLVERILSSHSQVASVGETEFLQMVLRRESQVPGIERMTPAMIRAVSKLDSGIVADGYIDAVRYRLGPEPLFIDKLPFNVLYAGFIAKAWPQRPIILLRRNPMDACFSMYKQVFTWAYKYSYTLENLATYYAAYERLCEHWRHLLGDRLIEVRYENLVADQEAETRHLLDRVGLPFEAACLDFHKNAAPTTTASSVQVRQKVHSGSVARWKRYESQLQPLKDALQKHGIAIEEDQA